MCNGFLQRTQRLKSVHAFGIGDRPWSDDIASYTPWPFLGCENVAQSIDARLGCRHMRLVGSTTVVQRSANVNIRPLSLADVRQCGFDGVVCPELVVVDLVSPKIEVGP